MNAQTFFSPWRRLLAVVWLTCIAPAVCHAGDLWEVYRTALNHDAAYRAASYTYQSAKLATPLARSAFFPQVTAQGSAERVRDKTDDGDEEKYEQEQITVTAELPLFDREIKNDFDQAKLATQRAGVRFKQAQQDLILRVAAAYFQLLAARDNREVALRQKLSIQRQMQFATERLEVGLGTRTDLYDAQARFQQAVADVIAAENVIDNAVQGLKQIVGETPAALTPLNKDAPLEQPAPPSVNAWVQKAMTGNLALREAEFGVQIAAEEIEKQRAVRWPRINLNANYRQFNTDREIGGNNFGDSDSSTVGATLNWPLFLGGAIHYRTKQAGLDYNAARQSTEELKRQVEAGTVSAYLAVTSGIIEVRALLEAVRAGESALHAKEEGFRAGLTTNLDVLDAQRDLARSRTEYLGARYDFILSVLRLEDAAGELDEADVKRINGWLE